MMFQITVTQLPAPPGAISSFTYKVVCRWGQVSGLLMTQKQESLMHFVKINDRLSLSSET